MLYTEISNDQSLTSETKQEIQIIQFNKEQANILHDSSNKIAIIGGPEDYQVSNILDSCVSKLKTTFNQSQNKILNLYKNNFIATLIFENMKEFSESNNIPNKLPSLSKLENSHEILYLGGGEIKFY